MRPDLSDYTVVLQKYGPREWTWRAWHVKQTAANDPLRPSDDMTFTDREVAEFFALEAIQHHAESERINGNELRDRVEGRR